MLRDACRRQQRAARQRVDSILPFDAPRAPRKIVRVLRRAATFHAVCADACAACRAAALPSPRLYCCFFFRFSFFFLFTLMPIYFILDACALNTFSFPFIYFAFRFRGAAYFLI